MHSIDLLNVLSEEEQDICYKQFRFFVDLCNILPANSSRLHSYFVDCCLMPFGYIGGVNDVYACLKEVETTPESMYITISLVTPLMAFTDGFFFSYGDEYNRNIPQNFYSCIRQEYRPYYYEYTTEVYDEDPLAKELLQHKIGVWFKARLAMTTSINGEYGIPGVLHFGGSEEFSSDVSLILENKDIADACDKLNEIYHVDLKVDKTGYSNYLSRNFNNTNSKFNVHVMNMGQANCIHITDTITKNTMFFDTGKPWRAYFDRKNKVSVHNTDYDPGSNLLKNLSRLKKYNPNCIVISHWHYDHFSAYTHLDYYKKNITWLVPWVSSEKEITSACRLVKYLQNKKTSHTVYCLDGEGLLYNDSNGLQIWKGQKTSDPNTGSIILRIRNTLFPGDSLYRYWPDDLVDSLGSISNLIVPHHGSSISQSLAAYQRNVLVIHSFSNSTDKNAYVSVGFNIYNHPNFDHLDDLGHKGFTNYITQYSNRNFYRFIIP